MNLRSLNLVQYASSAQTHKDNLLNSRRVYNIHNKFPNSGTQKGTNSLQSPPLQLYSSADNIQGQEIQAVNAVSRIQVLQKPQDTQTQKETSTQKESKRTKATSVLTNNKTNQKQKKVNLVQEEQRHQQDMVNRNKRGRRRSHKKQVAEDQGEQLQNEQQEVPQASALLNSQIDLNKATSVQIPENTKNSTYRLLSFLQLLMALKLNLRTGWVYKGVKECETVADHSYRMAIMAFLLDEAEYDVDKVMKLSIVHDMAECIVGDITPHCGISREKKLLLEYNGMQKVFASLGIESEAATEIQALWQEYEDRKTKEAQVVKDFDRIDLLLQAIRYQEEYSNVNYQEFFDSTRDTWLTDIGIQWNQYLVTMRSLQLQQKVAKGWIHRSVIENPQAYKEYSQTKAKGCLYNTSQVVSFLYQSGKLKDKRSRFEKVNGTQYEYYESDASRTYSTTTMAFLLNSSKVKNKNKIMRTCLLRALSNIFDNDLGEQEVAQQLLNTFGEKSQLGTIIYQNYIQKQKVLQQQCNASSFVTASQVDEVQKQQQQIVEHLGTLESIIWVQLFVLQNPQSHEHIIQNIQNNIQGSAKILDLFSQLPQQ